MLKGAVLNKSLPRIELISVAECISKDEPTLSICVVHLVLKGQSHEKDWQDEGMGR
jgi:hypothetical protein